MTSAREETQADEARAALLSDIRELESAEQRIVRKARSNLPWAIGGALGLLAISVVTAATSTKRRSFALAPPRRSWLGKAARAAGLAAVGLLTRRLVTQALDKALPEREQAAP